MRNPAFLRRVAAICVSTVAVMFAAAPLHAQGASASDADTKAIENFRLTMPVINQMAQVQENMYATVKAHPELAQKYADQNDDDRDDAKSIDDMAKKLDRVPEFKAAVIKAGFTPRSYMIATMATFQAAMASAVLDMPGADKSKIPANARANAAFLKAHTAEMQKLQMRSMELQKMLQQQSGDSDETAGEKPDSSGGRR
jgi:hypothetical protein